VAQGIYLKKLRELQRTRKFRVYVRGGVSVLEAANLDWGLPIPRLFLSRN
jgi:hypothetical protein